MTVYAARDIDISHAWSVPPGRCNVYSKITRFITREPWYIAPPAVPCLIFGMTPPRYVLRRNAGRHGNSLPTGRLWSISSLHVGPNQHDRIANDRIANANPKSNPSGALETGRGSRATSQRACGVAVPCDQFYHTSSSMQFCSVMRFIKLKNDHLMCHRGALYTTPLEYATPGDRARRTCYHRGGVVYTVIHCRVG